jgi:Tfp pilus assembly protein PilO
MKISKVFITVLFLGIVIIGGWLLYTLWHKELDRRDTQNAALASAQAQLPPIQAKVVSTQADLKVAQSQMSVAQASLATYKAQFPTPPPAAAIQSIDYAAKLFILAANDALNLSEFQSSPPASNTISGIKYQQTQMTIAVSGDIVDINNFIGNLETGTAYLTATIDSVDITFPTAIDPALGSVPPPQANIIITVTALEG